MTDDIVTRLRNYDFMRDGDMPEITMGQAAGEIERLRAERLKWFLVARQLRDAAMAAQEIDEAINNYLRVRGRLEDPRDAIEEDNGE